MNRLVPNLSLTLRHRQETVREECSADGCGVSRACKGCEALGRAVQTPRNSFLKLMEVFCPVLEFYEQKRIFEKDEGGNIDFSK